MASVSFHSMLCEESLPARTRASRQLLVVLGRLQHRVVHAVRHLRDGRHHAVFRILAMPRAATRRSTAAIPAANRNQESASVAWPAAAWRESAGIRQTCVYKLPLRRQLHVAQVEAQPHAIRFALHAAVRIRDRHVVHRLGVRAQQSVIETELPHQRHLLLQIRRRAERPPPIAACRTSSWC